MDLPGDGVTQETALDSDRDPMQGRTDDDGSWTLTLDLDPRNWPRNLQNNVGKVYDLLTTTRDNLVDMGQRTAGVVVRGCARGLGRTLNFGGRAAKGLYLLCTDPGQAAENLCNNVSGGIDRLTGIGERIWDDP